MILHFFFFCDTSCSMKSNLLNKHENILAWLLEHTSLPASSFHIHRDQEYGFIVDVMSSVSLDDLGLKCLPVKFNNIKGSFSVSSNELTSLYGSPIKCRSFDCSHNFLTTLEFCPTKIEGSLSFNSNNIEHLAFFPQSVRSRIYAHDNPLLKSAQDTTDVIKLFKVHERHKQKMLASSNSPLKKPSS